MNIQIGDTIRVLPRKEVVVTKGHIMASDEFLLVDINSSETFLGFSSLEEIEKYCKDYLLPIKHKADSLDIVSYGLGEKDVFNLMSKAMLNVGISSEQVTEVAKEMDRINDRERAKEEKLLKEKYALEG